MRALNRRIELSSIEQEELSDFEDMQRLCESSPAPSDPCTFDMHCSKRGVMDAAITDETTAASYTNVR